MKTSKLKHLKYFAAWKSEPGSVEDLGLFFMIINQQSCFLFQKLLEIHGVQGALEGGNVLKVC